MFLVFFNTIHKSLPDCKGLWISLFWRFCLFSLFHITSCTLNPEVFSFFSFQSNHCQPQRLKRRARKRLVPVNKISRPACKRRLLENYFFLILLFYHSAWNNENSGRLHALPCWDLGFKIWHSDVNKFDWLAKVQYLTSLSGSSLVEGRPWEPGCTLCATNSWQITT